MKKENRMNLLDDSMYMESVKAIYNDILCQKEMLEMGLKNDHIPKKVKEEGLLYLFKYLIHSYDRYCEAGKPTLDTAELINDAISKVEDAKSSIQDAKYDMDNIDEYALDDIITELEDHKESILEKQEVK